MDNKTIVKDFLDLVVKGKFDESYSKYVDMKGKHHNQYTPAGFDKLKQGMQENHGKIPNKKFSIKRILVDGNLVATHSHVILEKNTPGIAAVHIFRIENGKIMEMWDLGQPIDPKSPNKDGAF